MAREQDFSWDDDLMTKSYQRQESHLTRYLHQNTKLMETTNFIIEIESESQTKNCTVLLI